MINDKAIIYEKSIGYTVNIPLATKPDVPNVNGITYTKEAITEALKEYIDRTLYIEMGYPDSSCKSATWLSVDPLRCWGYVNAVNLDEQVANCTIWNEEHLKLLDSLCLGLKYLGNSNETGNGIVTKMKILSYCLIEKPKARLSSEYGEFNNKGEC